jgi:glycosyltransferase involved in cell wall biosynthesis
MTAARMPADVSIILCTYNRADSLRRTLQSFERLKVPEGVQAELLVVDNNSNDQTREVCSAARPTVPLRYIFEPEQGHNPALNRGLAEASAPLLLFTDDDVEVEEDWLAAYWEAAAGQPGATYFGGPVRTRWEAEPPRWFKEHATTLLRNLTVHLDGGPAGKEWMENFAGANMALRREGLHGTLFDPDLGPKGDGAVRCGEIELFVQLRKRGATGYYVPGAVIHHWTAPHRMTESYVRNWFVGDGMAEVRRGHALREHLILGVSRYYWKELITNSCIYALSRFLAPASVWLPAEIAMARAWGVIVESRHQTCHP